MKITELIHQPEGRRIEFKESLPIHQGAVNTKKILAKYGWRIYRSSSIHDENPNTHSAERQGCFCTCCVSRIEWVDWFTLKNVCTFQKMKVSHMNSKNESIVHECKQSQKS
ncbi:MAG: hypothetical protein WBP54_11900 [Pelodictyon phaeoclathratiforme]